MKLLSIVRPRCWFEGVLYRALMRFMHKRGWHYAPAQPVPEPTDSPPGTSFHWCQWCGLRGTTWKHIPGHFGPLKVTHPAPAEEE